MGNEAPGLRPAFFVRALTRGAVAADLSYKGPRGMRGAPRL